MTTTNLWNYIIIGQRFWQWQNQNKQIVLLIHRCVFCNARVWHQEWNVKWRNVSDRSKTNPHKREAKWTAQCLNRKRKVFLFCSAICCCCCWFLFWSHMNTLSDTEQCIQDWMMQNNWFPFCDRNFWSSPIVFGQQFLCRSSFFFSPSFFFSRQFSCDIFTPLVILSFHFVIVECFSGEFFYFLPLSFALLLSLGNVTLVSFYSIQFHIALCHEKQIEIGE